MNNAGTKQTPTKNAKIKNNTWDSRSHQTQKAISLLFKKTIDEYSVAK
jgi:hypothetical protein